MKISASFRNPYVRLSSQEELVAGRLPKELFSCIAEFLTPKERIQWKATCRAMRDACAFAEIEIIREIFATNLSQLRQIHSVFCNSDVEDLNKQLNRAHKRAIEFLKNRDPNFSPPAVPRNARIAPLLHAAYTEATQSLYDRDQILATFFEGYFYIQDRSPPDFFKEVKDIAEKANAIREHLKKEEYVLEKFFVRGRPFVMRIPPEALLFKMKSEMLRRLALCASHAPGLSWEFFFALTVREHSWVLKSNVDEMREAIKGGLYLAIRQKRAQVARELFKLCQFDLSQKELKRYEQTTQDPALKAALRETYQTRLSLERSFLRRIRLKWQGQKKPSKEPLFIYASPASSKELSEQEKRDLTLFFNSFFELHELPKPECQDANAIRRHFATYSYKLICTEDGYHLDMRSLPAEIAQLQMTSWVFIECVRDALTRQNWEFFFALLEDEKYPLFCKETTFLRYADWRYTEKALAEAVLQNRIRSVRILFDRYSFTSEFLRWIRNITRYGYDRNSEMRALIAWELRKAILARRAAGCSNSCATGFDRLCERMDDVWVCFRDRADSFIRCAHTCIPCCRSI